MESRIDRRVKVMKEGLIALILLLQRLVMVLVKLLLLLQLLAKFPAELLSVSCFVILKPVEDVLAFNLAIEREVGSDLLNLRSIGCSHSSPIHFLQDHELLWGWTPP